MRFAAAIFLISIFTTIPAQSGESKWTISDGPSGGIAMTYDGLNFGLFIECVTVDHYMLTTITDREYEATGFGGGVAIRVDNGEVVRNFGMIGDPVGQFAATKTLINHEIVSQIERAKESVTIALTDGDDIRFIAIASVIGSANAARELKAPCK